MSVFNDIQNILNTKLNTLGSLPTIYWPNDQNQPTQNISWLRPTLLPAASELYTLNNENYHQGIYQIDIFVPLKAGTSVALLIADTIRAGFNRQSLTANGTIVHVQRISISQSQREESWWHCYVEVNYLCVA